MKDFPLSINEGLANILKSATELHALVNAYVENEMKGRGRTDWEEFPAKQIGEMQDVTSDMISTLGEIIGYDIASQAFRKGGEHENN